MRKPFDPYHRWLGIPPDEQPANHYRLLGIRLFEAEPEVIENAADQRMGHLRNFQGGEHADLCAKLLNGLAAAKVCLLNPESRAAYDRRLREEFGLSAVSAPPLPAAEAPPPAAPPLPAAVVAPPPRQPNAQSDSGLNRLFSQTGPAPSSGTRRTARRGADPTLAVVAVVGVLLLIAVVVVAMNFSGGGSSDRALLVFDWPVSVRDGAVVTLNGESLEVPPSGAWEHPCSPGAHRLIASVPGYETIDRQLDLQAGDRCLIRVPNASAPRSKASPDGAKPSAEPATGPLQRDQWVDLLPHVLLRRDMLSGRWQKSGATLSVRPAPEAATRQGLLRLPIAVDGSYELELELTRTEADGPVLMLLPAGQSACKVELSPGRGIGCRLVAPDSSGRQLGWTPRGTIDNQRSCLLAAKVARGDKTVGVRVLLDGKPVLQWSDQASALESEGAGLRDPSRPQIGAQDASVTFSRARFRLLSGEATWVESSGGSATPAEKPPAAQTPEPVAAKGLLAEIFEGTDLETPIQRRIDPRIDFDWKRGPPGEGLPSDRFSIRWTGWITPPRPGAYTFLWKADNRVLFILDEKPKHSQYRALSDGRMAKFETILESRPYSLRIEYEEDTEDAYMQLLWIPPGRTAEEVIPADVLWHGPRPERPSQAAGQPSDVPVDVAGMEPRPFVAPEGAAMPPAIAGATAFYFPEKPSTDVRNGVLQFTVRKACRVFLLAHWKYEGNSRGGWTEDRLTREKLVEQGWKDLGPIPWDPDVFLFQRDCSPGESYRLRTNKYWPPRLLVAASGAASDPTTPPKPAPPSEASGKRLPAPADDRQREIHADLDDIYRLGEITEAAEKREVAAALRKLAGECGERPAERYVLLKTAAELAAAGGDVDLMRRALDALAAGFEVDALALRIKVLENLAGAADQPAALRDLVDAADQAIDRALDAGRYDLAGKAADLAYRTALKPAGADLRKRTFDRNQEVQALVADWQTWQEALSVLQASPDDPVANLDAGRWYCLHLSDWEKGLSYLSKSGDAKLKELAKRDTTEKPSDPTAQVALADAWFDAAEAAEKLDRPLMYKRAKVWYRKAQSGQLSSLVKVKVERRLGTIDEALGTERSSQAPHLEGFEPGKWAEVLPAVRTERDAVEGKWEWVGDDLIVTPARDCRLALPVTLSGSYDLEVEFVRTDGKGAVAMVFPVGREQITLVFSHSGGKCHGLELLQRRLAWADGNPSRRAPGLLQNGRRYTVLIGVRVEQEGALIDVVLNGKMFMKTAGPIDGLSLHTRWDLGDRRRAGLAAHESRVKFSRARIRLHEGQAEFLGGR